MPKSPSRSTQPAQRKITPELIADALASIPPDVDRDTWAKIGMAIKAEFPSAAGFDLWNEWSARGETYDARNASDAWRSIKAGGPVKIGTLFLIAKNNGFRFPEGEAVQASVPDAAALAEAERLADLKRKQRDNEAAEYSRRADKAARDALAMWADASVSGQSPYLVRKGVQGHGVRYLPNGTLLVPMCSAKGDIQNLQRIAPSKPVDDGPEKRFLPGGRLSGLWHLIGKIEGAPALLLAEGYATAASVHEATGRPVAVCFTAGNLVHVSKALRELWPALPFLVCGDDDRGTEARTGKNPGRDKAASAVRAGRVGGALASVVFPAGLHADATDFNDLAMQVGGAAGVAVVRDCVESAALALVGGQSSPVTPGSESQAAAAPGETPGGAAPGRNAPALRVLKGGKDDGAIAAGSSGGGRGPVNGEPADSEVGGGGGGGGGGRSGRVWRDQFFVNEAGLWFVARDNNGEDKPPLWVADPINVTAITRDESDNGYGYLIEFHNRDGNPRLWAAPSALFSGDASEWAAKLRDMGFRMATGARSRNLVGQYIDSRTPADRVTCTDRVGWHGGVYVLPSRCIGTVEGKRYVFQSDSGIEDLFRRRGDLANWQWNIARRSAGNSRLVFALTCAFAGPMVGLLGVQTGGFHLTGDSSLGKTTALLVAASVWGSPKFKQQWRSTDNGLESVAVQSSDSLLVLDEIGQMDGRMVGDCAYMLANESEKIRGSRGLLARRRRTWRLLFLSSGEKDLATHMLEAGKKPNEGQLIRMPSVPCDAGAGLGLLETLHDMPVAESSSKEYAEAITAAAAACYGVAGAAWLEWLADHLADVVTRAPGEMRRMENEWVPSGSHPQVWRVATRFALVAVAGELATEAGVTGWEAGESEFSARKCFDAWLLQRGHAGNGVEQEMLRAVRLHLETNGSALYQWTHRGTDDRNKETPYRCGFKRFVNESGEALKIDAATDYVDQQSKPESSEQRAALIEYMILPESFKRVVCKGFDSTAVAEVLRNRGHLIHQKDRLTSKQRLPGMGKEPVPCYHVRPTIFGDDLLAKGPVG